MPNEYKELCKAFGDIWVLTQNTSWKSITPWPPTGMAFGDCLDRGCKILPPGYKEAYLTPVRANVDSIAEGINGLYNEKLNMRWLEPYARSYVLLHSDSILGAATAWSDPRTLFAVQRFEAVVADIFESFITKAHSPVFSLLNRTIKRPPLVTFAPEPSFGPATLNADKLRGLCGPGVSSTQLDISVVSQPAGYADFPMLWGVLAHESGGHAVTHAVPGLCDELKRVVVAVRGLSEQGKEFWADWAEEAIADVYGLLNVGPSFALSLAAWLTMAKQEKTIGCTIVIWQGILVDPHAPDILRLYIARGVVEALTALYASKAAWLSAIDRAIASANTPDILIDRGDPSHPATWPLAEAGRDAVAIGAALVTAKLKSLGDHSIQEIETWSDDDEKVALNVKAAAQKGRVLTGLDTNDAHLIAGATMALSEDASLYAMLNRRLGEAFHHSYLTDTVFNGWEP